MNITIPLPEKVSTNQIYAGMHWSKRKKLSDLYHQSLIEHRQKKVEEYPVEITYIFNFKSKPLDTTNCTFMVKMLEDGLIAHGILKDDTPDHVSFTGIYSQKGSTDEVTINIV